MTESIPKKPLKKGSLVFVDKESYIKSIEALASDNDLPNYVFEGPGEILSVKDEYAQVRWRRPVPDVWLKLDQLKQYIHKIFIFKSSYFFSLYSSLIGFFLLL